MLTETKLVKSTHCSLQCWYRTSLVFRRKTNGNRNQTGTKKTHLLKYNAGIEPVSYSQEKQMLTEIKLVQNTHVLLLTMVVQNQSGIQKKTNANSPESNWSKNTHWSLQCWHRKSLVFKRKTNTNRNQTGAKYTLVLTMLVQNQSGIHMKNK